jgi:hypothetical protein
MEMLAVIEILAKVNDMISKGRGTIGMVSYLGRPLKSQLLAETCNKEGFPT